MHSLIDGFQYDVFISYRHKDNEYDGWVTDFVSNLQKELRATFKEEVSIYLDTNPHDGLLESHIVDRSLEGKLNCVIFIPVISQTYCDPNSFAWKHEFKAFLAAAGNDKLGLQVRLSGGNVASRVLPIRIHDLDEDDKALLEQETGGALRSIAFTYSAPGVNRPLRSNEDHPQDNLHKIYYRDQINKVANAIKEIISSLKSNKAVAEKVQTQSPYKPVERKRKIAMPVKGLAILLILLTAGYLLWPLIRQPETVNTRNSIAVIPFTNMSDDPDQEFFSDGITEQIITNLAQLKDLKVMARTSVMKYKNTTTSIAQIGKELNVTHVLEGSVRRSGDNIRITAQLIAVQDEFHVWADVYDKKDMTDVLGIQDEVSTKIARTLKNRLLPEEKEKLISLKPVNPEAYEHYLKAEYIHSNYYFVKFRPEDFVKSEAEYLKAIELDTTYALAYAGLANLYDSRYNFGEDREKWLALRTHYTDRAKRLAPQLPQVKLLQFYVFRDHAVDMTDSAYKYGMLAYESAPNNALISNELAMFFFNIGLHDQARDLFRQSIRSDPSSIVAYSLLGLTDIILGDLKSGEQNIRKGASIDSNSLLLVYPAILLNLIKKDYREVEHIIKKMYETNPSPPNNDYYVALLKALKGRKQGASDVNNSYLDFMLLGDKRDAMDVLEASRQLNYLYLKNVPLFDGLRENPRFIALLSKLKKTYDERIRKYPLKVSSK